MAREEDLPPESRANLSSPNSPNDSQLPFPVIPFNIYGLISGDYKSRFFRRLRQSTTKPITRPQKPSAKPFENISYTRDCAV
jgi:hypothetical protein